MAVLIPFFPSVASMFSLLGEVNVAAVLKSRAAMRLWIAGLPSPGDRQHVSLTLPTVLSSKVWQCNETSAARAKQSANPERCDVISFRDVREWGHSVAMTKLHPAITVVFRRYLLLGQGPGKLCWSPYQPPREPLVTRRILRLGRWICSTSTDGQRDLLTTAMILASLELCGEAHKVCRLQYSSTRGVILRSKSGVILPH